MTNATNYEQPQTIQSSTRATARVKLTHADLTDGATSQVFLLSDLRGRMGDTVPANARIKDAQIVRITDFSGGGSAAATVGLGDDIDPDELIAAADVFTGAKATAAISVANGVYTLGTFEAALYLGQVTITSDVFVNLLTAGACELRIIYEAFDASSRI